MTEIVSISAVEAILFGVLKVTWTDGFQALADLRPVLSRGDVFEFLRRTPRRFDDVKLAEFGHAVHWLGDDETRSTSVPTRSEKEPSAEPMYRGSPASL